jgi:hypothetical protein
VSGKGALAGGRQIGGRRGLAETLAALRVIEGQLQRAAASAALGEAAFAAAWAEGRAMSLDATVEYALGEEG